MPTDTEVLRDLARSYWSGQTLHCPKHAAGTLTGSFVQTTFADHIALVCSRGRETLNIPQRPKQTEFQAQQVEGYIENLQRGDAILCYRCQASVEASSRPDPGSGSTEYTFTCTRCLSWGTWKA